MKEPVKVVDEKYAGGKEVPGLTADQIIRHFQELIDNGQLRAISFKRVIQEKIILQTGQAYIIEDPKTGEMYVLETNSRGVVNPKFPQYCLYPERLLVSYNYCLLERLIEGFDLKQVREQEGQQRTRIVEIPKLAVIGRLELLYNETEMVLALGKNYVISWSASLSVEDKQDRLFEQICTFIRNQVARKETN